MKYLLLPIFILLPLISLSGTTRIVSKELRNNSLQEVERLFATFQEIGEHQITMNENFFFAKEPFVEQEEVVEEEKVIVALTDLQVLEEISKQVRPNGVVTFSGKNYLLMGGREQIGDGDSISVRVQNKTYTITFGKVTTQTYTIYLNDEALTAPVKNNKNNISFDK